MLDTSQGELQNQVKVLLILSAIPVVLQAIWADYFERELEVLKKDKPDFDRAGEHFKVKVAALFGLFFQLLVFLGAADVRKEYPILANLIFIATLAVHMWIQSSAEKKIPPVLAKPGQKTAAPQAADIQRNDLTTAFRAFAWSLVSGVLYIGLLIAFMRGALAVAQAIQATPGQGLLLMAAGSALGILCGLGFGFAFGPYQMRQMFPSSPLENGELRNRLENDFKGAGIRVPSIWVVDLGPRQPGNALIAGFRGGRGIFRPSLFLSKGLLAKLNPNQLRAIVLHEIAHLRLSHLPKRFLLSFGLILGTSILAGSTALSVLVIFPKSGASWMLSLAIVLGSLFYSFSYLAQQSRRHELEADLEAIRLGANVDELCTALRTLDEMNGIRAESETPSGAHPATRDRIQRLQTHFEMELQRAEQMAAGVPPLTDAPAKSDSEKKAA